MKITALHGKGKLAQTLLTRVSQQLHDWKQIAEQLPSCTVWQQACQFITTAVTGFNWLEPPQNRLKLTLETG